MKYALLKYNTRNLGDDIQSLAAKRFLPRVDYYIDRDSYINFGIRYLIDNLCNIKKRGIIIPSIKRIFNEMIVHKKTKIIFNGWFTNTLKDFPIKNDFIKPLFVSYHINHSELANPKCVKYYKQHEPIGCRDYATLNHLKKKGVDAYFSGCLTLTLQNKFKKRNSLIYFTDIYSKKTFFKKIPSKIRNSIRILSHERKNFFKVQTKERFRIAQQFIDAYSKAKLVVTSKLHCALPCLALGTPVIFIHPNLKDERFGGIIELMRHHSLDDLNRGKVRINWDNPGPNPVDISPLRKKLIKTCEDFIKNN